MARKRSPKSPVFPLPDAIERAVRVYNEESLNTIPSEAAARAMGYNTMSGRARRALATLKMYGLLETSGQGEVSVSRELQAYKLAPADEDKHQYLIGFLREPEIFQQLLERYPDRLPSDGTLTHHLVVDRGFLEPAAKDLVKCFRESVEFANYQPGDMPVEPSKPKLSSVDAESDSPEQVSSGGPSASRRPDFRAQQLSADYDDPLPVRLKGGRKAWITLPRPFYDSDKSALIGQIELLIADEVEEVS